MTMLCSYVNRPDSFEHNGRSTAIYCMDHFLPLPLWSKNNKYLFMLYYGARHSMDDNIVLMAVNAVVALMAMKVVLMAVVVTVVGVEVRWRFR